MRKEQRIEAIESKAENFSRLGAVQEADGVRFSMVFSQGETAFLLLYLSGESQPAAEIPFPEKAVVGNIHSMLIQHLDWKHYEYNFKLGNQVMQDPYARSITGRSKFGEQSKGEHQVRCGFDFAEYDWQEDEPPCIPYEDAVMYHLHVRNFTMNKRSGVKHKGTFLGLEEKIPYLKELGINQVKLMPVYEFNEFPEYKEPIGAAPFVQPPAKSAGAVLWQDERERKMNCWGYGSGNYFAPKKSYAASEDAVKELKHMVRAFHENQMEVILDFYFDDSVTPRMVFDCLTHWVLEYHIDGFQILGVEETGGFLAEDPVFSNTKILCSYFPEKKGKKETGFFRNSGELNDGFLMDMRRILKGDEGALEQFAYRSRRNSSQMGIINYITNHDGFTLRDLVSYDVKHNEENGERNEDGSSYNFSWNCGVEGETRKKAVLDLRSRQMKNAVLILMLSQGVPMLMAGDEFGNSQNGNNNPYCLDNETSWVSWNRYGRDASFTEFVKKAIRFRKDHRILHMEKELRMTDYKTFGYPDLSYHSSKAWYGGFEYESRQLGMMFCGRYAGEKEFLYAAYNFHPLEQELALPKLPEGMKWYKTIDTSLKDSFTAAEEMVPETNRTCLIPARTIIVLTGREA